MNLSDIDFDDIPEETNEMDSYITKQEFKVVKYDLTRLPDKENVVKSIDDYLHRGKIGNMKIGKRELTSLRRLKATSLKIIGEMQISKYLAYNAYHYNAKELKTILTCFWCSKKNKKHQYKTPQTLYQYLKRQHVNIIQDSNVLNSELFLDLEQQYTNDGTKKIRSNINEKRRNSTETDGSDSGISSENVEEGPKEIVSIIYQIPLTGDGFANVALQRRNDSDGEETSDETVRPIYYTDDYSQRIHEEFMVNCDPVELECDVETDDNEDTTLMNKDPPGCPDVSALSIICFENMEEHLFVTNTIEQLPAATVGPKYLQLTTHQSLQTVPEIVDLICSQTHVTSPTLTTAPISEIIVESIAEPIPEPIVELIPEPTNNTFQDTQGAFCLQISCTEYSDGNDNFVDAYTPVIKKTPFKHVRRQSASTRIIKRKLSLQSSSLESIIDELPSKKTKKIDPYKFNEIDSNVPVLNIKTKNKVDLNNIYTFVFGNFPVYSLLLNNKITKEEYTLKTKSVKGKLVIFEELCNIIPKLKTPINELSLFGASVGRFNSKLKYYEVPCKVLIKQFLKKSFDSTNKDIKRQYNKFNAFVKTIRNFIDDTTIICRIFLVNELKSLLSKMHENKKIDISNKILLYCCRFIYRYIQLIGLKLCHQTIINQCIVVTKKDLNVTLMVESNNHQILYTRFANNVTSDNETEESKEIPNRIQNNSFLRITNNIFYSHLPTTNRISACILQGLYAPFRAKHGIVDMEYIYKKLGKSKPDSTLKIIYNLKFDTNLLIDLKLLYFRCVEKLDKILMSKKDINLQILHEDVGALIKEMDFVSEATTAYRDNETFVNNYN